MSLRQVTHNKNEKRVPSGLSAARLVGRALMTLLVFASFMSCDALEAMAQDRALGTGDSLGSKISAPSVGVDSQSNLFLPGNFSATKGNLPPGWGLWDKSENKVRLVGDNGQRYLLLNNNDPRMSVGLVAHLRLEPGWKHLRVSMKMMGQNLQPGELIWQRARVGLRFEDMNKHPVGGYLPSPSIAADTDWRLLEARLEVPSGAAFLVLEPGLYHTTGLYGVSDIRVVPERESAAPEGDPFPQGAFDRVELNDGLPRNWYLWDKSEGHVGMIDERGNRWLQLTNDDPSVNVGLVTMLKLKPEWKALRLTTRMAGKNLKGGKQPWQRAHITFQFEDNFQNRVGAMPPSLSLAEDTIWKTMSLELSIPQGATYLKIEPGLVATTGVLGVDDIQVTGLNIINASDVQLSTPPVSNGSPAINPVKPQMTIIAKPMTGVFKEGAFDRAKIDGNLPVGWQTDAKSQAKVTIVDEDGNRYLQITNDDPTLAVSVTTKLKLEPEWKTLVLKTKLAAQNLQVGRADWHNARLPLRFVNDQDEKVGTLPPPFFLAADADWKTMEMKLTIPPGATYLKLQPGLYFATGLMKLDDIVIQPE